MFIDISYMSIASVCCYLSLLPFHLRNSYHITVTFTLSPLLTVLFILSVPVLCLELQSNEQAAGVECLLALWRDNKPICYLLQWTLQQLTHANSQRPS